MSGKKITNTTARDDRYQCLRLVIEHRTELNVRDKDILNTAALYAEFVSSGKIPIPKEEIHGE